MTTILKLNHGYNLEFGYHHELGKKYFFVGITKDGENICYDSKLIEEEIDEIMINGVDVSGCDYFLPLDNGVKACKAGMKQLIKYNVCECNHNCLYKQLQRKEQEYKELKCLKQDWLNLSSFNDELEETLKTAKLEILDNIDDPKRLRSIIKCRDEQLKMIQDVLDKIEKECACARDVIEDSWDRKIEDFAKEILTIINEANNVNR